MLLLKLLVQWLGWQCLWYNICRIESQDFTFQRLHILFLTMSITKWAWALNLPSDQQEGQHAILCDCWPTWCRTWDCSFWSRIWGRGLFFCKPSVVAIIALAHSIKWTLFRCRSTNWSGGNSNWVSFLKMLYSGYMTSPQCPIAVCNIVTRQSLACGRGSHKCKLGLGLGSRNESWCALMPVAFHMNIDGKIWQLAALYNLTLSGQTLSMENECRVTVKPEVRTQTVCVKWEVLQGAGRRGSPIQGCFLRQSCDLAASPPLWCSSHVRLASRHSVS